VCTLRHNELTQYITSQQLSSSIGMWQYIGQSPVKGICVEAPRSRMTDLPLSQIEP
jgi:hypothetical protein